VKKQAFPKGWNEKRVRKVIAHYDKLSDEELAAEDEVAIQAQGRTTESSSIRQSNPRPGGRGSRRKSDRE
jgi:hypothetical protein